MVETKVYVGLNDAVTKQQIFETEKYISVLQHVCLAYGVSYSFSILEGGYIHKNGDVSRETTLLLNLIDIKRETVDAIARDLCAFFHQESVLITRGHVGSYFIKSNPLGTEKRFRRKKDQRTERVIL